MSESPDSTNPVRDNPDNAVQPRNKYAHGAPIRDIRQATGFSDWTLYRWIAGGPKDATGRPLLPPLGKRRKAPQRIMTEDRLTLASRMMRAAEAQIGEIEARLAGSSQALGDRERCARTLALLARTLQSLTALDARHETDARKRRIAKEKTSKDEPVPRSIDELRRSVAAKLAAIVAQRHSEGNGGA